MFEGKCTCVFGKWFLGLLEEVGKCGFWGCFFAEWEAWSVKMGVAFCTCLLVFCGGYVWFISYLCDSGCYLFEYCFFLNLYKCFSLLKKEAWGLERLN